jgi:hypothetical protein
LNDLIGEAKEVSRVINEAHESIERANTITRATASQSVPSVQSQDQDLFSFDDIPAPAKQPELPPPSSISHNFSSNSIPDRNATTSQDFSEASSVPQPQLSTSRDLSGSSSLIDTDELEDNIASPSSNPQQSFQAQQQKQQPPYQQQQQHQQPLQQFMPYQQPKQPPISTPQYSFNLSAYNDKPATMHERNVSTASGFDFSVPMGGGPSFALSSGSIDLHSGPSGSMYDIASATSTEDLGKLKQQVKDAEEIARQAEESRRQSMAEANEMRRLADEAEAESRQAAAAASDPKGKRKSKSGFWGGGKNKKEAVSCVCASCI